MNKKYQINYLSQAFFDEYNATNFPEIENKANRPYMVLLVKIENNLFAIPFRTNVRHNECYKFKSTSRNTQSASGLDYSKAVIVNDSKYIGEQAFIDKSEYMELSNKYGFIIKQFASYVNGYKRLRQGKTNPFVEMKYRYSTLKYFHKYLGLDKL